MTLKRCGTADRCVRGKAGYLWGGVYKIIEMVDTSAFSWEDATKVAVETASKTLEDLRIAEAAQWSHWNPASTREGRLFQK